MKITQSTLRQLIQEELADLTEEPGLAGNEAGAARLDARERVRVMATDLFATADALSGAGLIELSDRASEIYRALGELHSLLGDGRDLGDV